MLTRLEVRGFKNLLDTRAEFGPFTCIAGANGIGKSNVFDAIEFLSYLASDPLVEASQRVRGSAGMRGGDVRDLFWDGYRDHERRIDLAVEMLVPAEVEDDLGAAGRLSDLAGVRVEDLTVELNQVREVFTLVLRERGGPRLPARALSVGTLRFLALCVLLEDPGLTGLLCMEEPENGIHPANLPSVMQLVRDLAVDPSDAPDETNPFRQVIVNTHAPGVVQLCDPSDLPLAELAPHRTAEGNSVRARTLLPFRDSWRTQSASRSFSEADVLSYLTAPIGAQLQLPMVLAG
jgi:predicted ATPase